MQRKDGPMRRLSCTALLTMLCLTPAVAHAQNKEARGAERQIDTVLKAFNEELRGFERELKYFDKVREFKPMLDLRNQLVNQSTEMLQLEQAGPGSGPKIRELVRAMDHETRELSAMSGVLRSAPTRSPPPRTKRSPTASSCTPRKWSSRSTSWPPFSAERAEPARVDSRRLTTEASTRRFSGVGGSKPTRV